MAMLVSFHLLRETVSILGNTDPLPSMSVLSGHLDDFFWNLAI